MSANSISLHDRWSRSVRVADGVRLRHEAFGAVAYVPEKDRFVGLDQPAADLLRRLRAGEAVHDPLIRQFEAAGLVEGQNRRPPPGRSLIGGFPELPVVAAPLVVNVFATANCPLRCRYCHADDLMQPFRDGETDDDIERVAETARAVPALVAVVTGGDPIVNPGRTSRLISRLAPEKAIVVDTSGAGDVTPLLPVLKEVQGHLRVSVDSADARLHDRLRPINPRLLPRGTSSHRVAWDTIERAVAADVATTVQTVVSRANQDESQLIALARQVAAAGVRNWVLHIAVPAGKAADPRNQDLLPTAGVRALLDRVGARLAAEEAFKTLRVRMTATHATPNAVLLVGSRGDLYVETGPTGKIKIASAVPTPSEATRLFQLSVDVRAHTNRYLGGTAPFLEPDQPTGTKRAAEA